MTNPGEFGYTGPSSQKDFGGWAESQVLLALRSRYPELMWSNLNASEPNGPFDLVGSWPDTGEVCWLVEVKGTDFNGFSPGITMRKPAKARKLAYAKSSTGRAIMACYDWQTGQIVARVGIACFHISEMGPVSELPNVFTEELK